MKKILIGSAIVSGVLILVLMIAVIVLPMFIDPNQHKDKITDQVRKHLGRELTIKGKISLSIFPWLGIRIGAMDLGNAPGFEPDPQWTSSDPGRFPVTSGLFPRLPRLRKFPCRV